MSTMTAAVAATNLMRVAPYFRMMKALKNKPDKTAEEYEALRSFRNSNIATGIISGIAVILVCISTVMFLLSFSSTSYDNRGYGTVTGESVRYIYGEEQLVSLGRLGIDKESVSDGDRVMLEFNEDGTLTGNAMLVDEVDSKSTRALITFVISFVISIAGTVIASMIVRATLGKPYREFARKSECTNCGTLNIRAVGAEKWVCESCGSPNSRDADRSEYERRIKRRDRIAALIIVIIILALLPLYISSMNGGFLSEETSRTISNGVSEEGKEQRQQMIDNLKNIGGEESEESAEPSKAEQKEETDASEDEPSIEPSPSEDKPSEEAKDNDGVDRAGEEADKIHEILNNLN